MSTGFTFVGRGAVFSSMENCWKSGTATPGLVVSCAWAAIDGSAACSAESSNHGTANAGQSVFMRR